MVITGVKIFSATKAAEREGLGERLTTWLKATKANVVRTDVLQSSDSQFHCLTFAVFYSGELAPVPPRQERD